MKGSGRDFVQGTSVMKAATLVASATLGIVLSAAELRADEPPRAAPAGSPSRGWTGAYVGGHLGYAWGDADWTAYGPGATVTTGGFDYGLAYNAFKGTGSYFGGSRPATTTGCRRAS